MSTLKHVGKWAFPADDEFMVGQLSPAGDYQRSHLDAALVHVTDWTRVADCGAHVGTWSRVLSQRFARVIAFEPSETFEALAVNMAAFGCANVELHHVALGDSPGLVRMAALEPRAAALKNTGALFTIPGGSIPRVTIDSFEWPTLGFLKIDTEGSEPAILRGSDATLDRCRPIVLYEDKYLWKRFGEPRDAPKVILRRHGYRPFQRVSMDEIWGPAT